MITLDDLVNELLSIDKIEIKDKPSFFNRIGDKVKNIHKRRIIDKQIQDEIESDKQRLISLGNSAQSFLNSPYYKHFIDSFIRVNVKGGLQNLFTNYEEMTETQIKSELAGIMKCLRLVASIKLKVLQGEQEKGGIK